MLKRDFFGKRIIPIYDKWLALFLALLILILVFFLNRSFRSTIVELKAEQQALLQEVASFETFEEIVVDLDPMSISMILPIGFDSYQVQKEVNYALELSRLDTDSFDYSVKDVKIERLSDLDTRIAYKLVSLDLETSDLNRIPNFLDELNDTNQLFLLEDMVISLNGLRMEVELDYIYFYQSTEVE